MMTLAGYKLYWRCRRQLRDLRTAYENMLRELIAERERSSHVAWLASTPCTSCLDLETQLADALVQRDQWQAGCQFLERIGFSVPADGSEA